ncbi:MAG: alpha/beta hydrolase [Pseudomonadota bacterium]
MVRKFMLFLIGLLVLCGLLFVLGPREPVDEVLAFAPSQVGDDIESYLKRRETGVEAITPGAEKQVVWHNGNVGSKTPYSIVYIHGFSATAQEIRPVPDMVANTLGANLHFTRLKGHGRDGDAMAEATVNDWLNDTAEALEIGRRIGEKVIVISTSTGGTLSSWAEFKPEIMDGVAGHVMVSPNFTVQAGSAEILTMPFARAIVPIIAGAQRSFEPANEGQAKWWTTTYPTVAVIPMQAIVAHTRALPFEQAKRPALFVFHPDDGVVKSDVTKAIAERWGKEGGGAATVFEVSDSGDAYNHVIAGDVLSPQNNQPFADRIIEWVEAL